MRGRKLSGVAGVLFLGWLALAPAAWAGSYPDRVRPVFSPRPSVSPRAERPRPQAVLREAKHTERLGRVQGIVRGMGHKLDNLSQRLTRQLAAVMQRLEAMEKAGKVFTVEKELESLQEAMAATQAQITATQEALAALPEEERPREQVARVRASMKELRASLVRVREAFQALRLAIQEDIRVHPSDSPLP